MIKAQSQQGRLRNLKEIKEVDSSSREHGSVLSDLHLIETLVTTMLNPPTGVKHVGKKGEWSPLFSIRNSRHPVIREDLKVEATRRLRHISISSDVPTSSLADVTLSSRYTSHDVSRDNPRDVTHPKEDNIVPNHERSSTRTYKSSGSDGVKVRYLIETPKRRKRKSKTKTKVDLLTQKRVQEYRDRVLRTELDEERDWIHEPRRRRPSLAQSSRGFAVARGRRGSAVDIAFNTLALRDTSPLPHTSSDSSQDSGSEDDDQSNAPKEKSFLNAAKKLIHDNRKEERQNRKASFGTIVIAEHLKKHRVHRQRAPSLLSSSVGTRRNSVRWLNKGQLDLAELAMFLPKEVVEDIEAEKSRQHRQRYDNCKFKKKGQALQAFRKFVKKIMLARMWVSVILKHDKNIEVAIKSFTDMAREIEEHAFQKLLQEYSGISFNKNDYKASKEMMLSSGIRKILTLDSTHRTKEMIKKCVYALQGVQAFADYPLHMQKKIATIGYYQTCMPKKIIIRQGQTGENFYIIITGSAYVKITYKVNGEISTKTVAVMRGGQCFGDLALLYNCTRTATVESVSLMQLLVIRREDYQTIFMGGMGRGMDEEPEHIVFCRSLEFMQGWPVEKLIENRGQLCFNYFRRGAVIIKDSTKDTDWIYVVKSGSCDVLQEIEPFDYKSIEMTDLQKTASISFPRIGTAEPGPRIDNGKVHRRTDVLTTDIEEESMSTMGDYDSGESDRKTRLPRITLVHQKLVSTLSGDESENYKNYELTRVDSAPSRPDATADRTDHESRRKERALSEGHSPSKFGEVWKFLSNQLVQQESGDENTRKERRSATDRGDTSNKKQPSTSSGSSSADKGKSFVVVDRLTERDVFGLENIQFEDEGVVPNLPKVSLVSNGAELILISRRFYMLYCDEAMKTYLRQRPGGNHPDEAEICRNLVNNARWEDYKDKQINSFFKEHHDKERLQRQKNWCLRNPP